MKINPSITFFISLTSAQDIQYAALLVPQELKENANAVIRNQSTKIVIEDIDKMIVTKRKVVTVF